MPNVTVTVDHKGFDEALRDCVNILKKDASKEVMRQGKLLALAIASAAPPRIKGLNGLAAGLPRAKGEARMKVLKRLIKPAYSMRVIDVAKMGPTEEGLDVLYGIATTRKKTVFTGQGKQSLDNALQRILNAAQKDTIGAMKNLRQLLNGAPNGITPQLYQDYNKKSSAHYKRLLDRMGKEGLKNISWADRVFLREPIKKERAKILAEYIPTIGTVKAGWVQAAMAIPVNAGRKPPNWLLNKKVIGSAAIAQAGAATTITIGNGKGNALNFNSRVDYVGRAIRFRRLKMINGIKGFLLRKFRGAFKDEGYGRLDYAQFDSKKVSQDDFDVPIY